VYTEQALRHGLEKRDNRKVSYLYHLLAEKNLGPYVRSRGGKEEDVRLVVQETLIRVYENLVQKKNYSEKGSFVGYCYRIGQYTWLDVCRRRKREAELYSDVDIPDDFDELDRYETLLAREALFEKMYAALNRLGERCQKLLKAYHLEGLRFKEIEKRMGYAKGSAKNQKSKCLKKLRKYANQ